MLLPCVVPFRAWRGRGVQRAVISPPPLSRGEPEPLSTQPLSLRAPAGSLCQAPFDCACSLTLAGSAQGALPFKYARVRMFGSRSAI